VSTQEQAESGLGLEGQKQALIMYCQLRGLALIRIEADEGVSASIPLLERERGLELMLATTPRKKGCMPEASEVVAVKLDRLFRSAEDALTTVRQWDDCGTTMHILDLGGASIDTHSAVGKFVLTLLAGVAEMERSLTRERTVAALGAKRARGEKCGGHVEYGFDAVPVDGTIRLVPNAHEQGVIRRMQSEHDDGISLRGIADRLNQDGVPTKLGRLWHVETVGSIIRRARPSLTSDTRSDSHTETAQATPLPK